MRGVLVEETKEGKDSIAVLGDGAGVNWKEDVGEAVIWGGTALIL